MKSNNTVIITTIALSIFLSGCSDNFLKNAGNMGAVIGAEVGDKFNFNNSSALGALIGKQLGDGFVKYLNEAEKKQAIEAAKQSLRTDNQNTVAWKSKTNNNVQGTATATPATNSGCRNINMTIIKNGKQHNDTVRFCKDPKSGNLEPA